MKKIAILTLPLTENFGGILQATALYNFLVDKNFDVIFLKNSYLKSRWKTWFWTVIEKIPFHNFKNQRSSYLKKQFHQPFISEHIPKQSSTLSTMGDFKKIAEKHEFDAVIVGSDQVWRWDYISDGFERYFLSFVNEKRTRKIAYGASFGKSYWQASHQKNYVADLLKSFHAISTREMDALTICEKLEAKNCQLVLDPTLLVDKSFYDRFLLKPSSQPLNKMMLTYLLDESKEKNQFVEHVHQTLGTKYEHISITTRSTMTVQAWVTAFHNADFVVTDSFHGMVFSILFNKQFAVIGNTERGMSRFLSLLKQLDMMDRLLYEPEIHIISANELVKQHIDYGVIEPKLKQLRNQSAVFLINAIQ